MSCTLLHMRPLFYNKESHPGCPNLSFIMTTANQSITTMIWLPSQIKNHNCLVEAMPSIVLSPDHSCDTLVSSCHDKRQVWTTWKCFFDVK